jgi:hypothetical protein
MYYNTIHVDYSHPDGVTSLPLGKLIDGLDVFCQHGSSRRPIVRVHDTGSKLVTGDEKLEERVYMFHSADREGRTR